MPNPRTSDTNGAGTHGDGGPDLRTVVSLLPTPAVNDPRAALLVEKSKPDAESGCVVWTGWTSGPYGKFSLRNKKEYAHRASYEVHRGPIPDGYEIDHLCQNPLCIRPDHLEAVTPEENRRRVAERRTHCKRGHEFTEENTYWVREGARACRACRAWQDKVDKARRRGEEIPLLPTPVTNDMGAGKTPDAWDAWTEAMQARHGNGNGHGKSLEIEAQRLLPTTRATDGTKGGPNQHGSSGDLMLPSAVQDWREYEPAIRRQENAFGRIAPDPTEVTPQSRKACAVHGDPQEGRPREGVSDLRSSAGAQEIREREAGGPERLSEAASLLPELREHQGGDHAIGSPIPGQAIPEGGVRGVRLNDSAARPSQGPELAERRPGEPDDAVRVVPPEAALAGGQRDSDGIESVGQGCTCKHRLSARFAEFLMGLPAGWVTDVPGLTRAEELKALGNGVVPQQASAACVAFAEDLAAEVGAA